MIIWKITPKLSLLLLLIWNIDAPKSCLHLVHQIKLIFNPIDKFLWVSKPLASGMKDPFEFIICKIALH